MSSRLEAEFSKSCRSDKLVSDQARVEDAMSRLVLDVTGLDAAVKHGLGADSVALRVTAAMLTCSTLQSHLCGELITLWNELK
jgi:hypothetical protein